MYELTQADMIWNRACGSDPLRSLPGDRALTDLLQAHGLAMNGGVLHAVECLTVKQLSSAQDGYRYYRLNEVADLFSNAKGLFDAGENLGYHELKLDSQYASLIPSDNTLLSSLRGIYG